MELTSTTEKNSSYSLLQQTELIAKLPHAKCTSRDLSTWVVSVYGKNFKRLCNIEIQFNENFPKDPPILRVNPIVNHQWIDPTTGYVIGHQALHPYTWDPNTHVDHIVQDIVNQIQENCHSSSDFQKTRPQKEAYNSYQLKHSSTTDFDPNSRIPLHPSMIPELENYNTRQLQQLLDYQPLLKHLIYKSPKLKFCVNELEAAVKECSDVMEATVAMKSSIEKILEQKNRLTNELHKSESTIKQFLKSLEEVQKVLEPNHIQELVSMEAQRLGTESESILNSFIGGKLTMEEFEEQYIDIRNLYHKQRAIYEKLHYEEI